MAQSARKKTKSAAKVSPALPVASGAPSPLLALAVITGIGALLRAWYLHQPIRYDEAYTYLSFARLPWREAIAYYPVPNNHVFHTLLVKAAVSAFGNHPWAIRLPAFVAGVATIPAAYFAGRALYGARVALMTAALVAGCGALTLYSTNARGYGFVVLATLVLVVVAQRGLRAPAFWPWAAYVAVGALGVWTVPTMLYPLGGVSLWFAVTAWRADAAGAPVSRNAQFARVVLATAAACAIGLLLYAPILRRSGLVALNGNAFVTPSTFAVFFSELPKGISDTARLFLVGTAWPVTIVLVICAVAGVVFHRGLSATRVPILIPMAAWCTAVLVANHRVPFVRVWLFLLPLLLMVATVGVVALLTRSGSVSTRAFSLTAIGVAFVMATATIVNGGVGTSRDTGTFFDAEAVAQRFRTELRPGDRIVTAMPTNMPLTYWMYKLGVDSAYMTTPAEQTRRFLLIVNTGEGETESAQLLRRRFVNNPALSEPKTLAEFPRAKVIAVERR
jgi:hypothetical protein